MDPLPPETRSSTPEPAAWVPSPLLCSPPPGGRQDNSPPPAPGGGYLAIRSDTEFQPPNDPRAVALRDAGLQAAWIAIAGKIGIDHLLVVWRRLSSDPAFRTDDCRIEVPIRSFRAYVRGERNAMVLRLDAEGAAAHEIQRLVWDRFGERMSRSQIYRIVRQAPR